VIVHVYQRRGMWAAWAHESGPAWYGKSMGSIAQTKEEAIADAIVQLREVGVTQDLDFVEEAA
jgi:hypothetical protein